MLLDVIHVVRLLRPVLKKWDTWAWFHFKVVKLQNDILHVSFAVLVTSKTQYFLGKFLCLYEFLTCSVSHISFSFLSTCPSLCENGSHLEDIWHNQSNDSDTIFFKLGHYGHNHNQVYFHHKNRVLEYAWQGFDLFSLMLAVNKGLKKKRPTSLFKVSWHKQRLTFFQGMHSIEKNIFMSSNPLKITVIMSSNPLKLTCHKCNNSDFLL